MRSGRVGIDVRVEWGPDGLAALLPHSDVVVVVDVLSFSSCVDVAVAAGAVVIPFDAPGDAARSRAADMRAACAGPRGESRFSLSPASFLTIRSEERVVLPSPNGGSLSCRTGSVPTLTACLRNAGAVAEAAMAIGGRLAIIPAGERWPSGGLRFALEDWIGAGAVIASLRGNRSSEAAAAASAFDAAAGYLERVLADCTSGRELVGRGYERDVMMAARVNESRAVPVLSGGGFVNRGGEGR